MAILEISELGPTLIWNMGILPGIREKEKKELLEKKFEEFRSALLEDNTLFQKRVKIEIIRMEIVSWPIIFQVECLLDQKEIVEKTIKKIARRQGLIVKQK